MRVALGANIHKPAIITLQSLQYKAPTEVCQVTIPSSDIQITTIRLFHHSTHRGIERANRQKSGEETVILLRVLIFDEGIQQQFFNFLHRSVSNGTVLDLHRARVSCERYAPNIV